MFIRHWAECDAYDEWLRNYKNCCHISNASDCNKKNKIKIIIAQFLEYSSRTEIANIPRHSCCISDKFLFPGQICMINDYPNNIRPLSQLIFDFIQWNVNRLSQHTPFLSNRDFYPFGRNMVLIFLWIYEIYLSNNVIEFYVEKFFFFW